MGSFGFLSQPLWIFLSLVLKAKYFEDGRLLLMQPSLTCCEGAKITQTSLCGGCAGGLVV